MAKHLIDKHTLKEDKIRKTLQRFSLFLLQKKAWVITLLVGVLAAAGGFGAFQYWQQQNVLAFSESFYALEKKLGWAGAGRVHILPKAEEANGFVKGFSTPPHANYASLFALLEAEKAFEAEDWEKSRAAFTKVLNADEATDFQQDLARLGLATLDAKTGEKETSLSAAVYESLSSPQFEVLKSYHLGRLAAQKGDREAAEKFFQKVEAGGEKDKEWVRWEKYFIP